MRIDLTNIPVRVWWDKQMLWIAVGEGNTSIVMELNAHEAMKLEILLKKERQRIAGQLVIDEVEFPDTKS